jgi:hypothetical protein
VESRHWGIGHEDRGEPAGHVREAQLLRDTEPIDHGQGEHTIVLTASKAN